MANSSRQEPQGYTEGNRSSPCTVQLPPLHGTISNQSQQYFRNPSTGFVYRDMYDTEPISSLPDTSQEGGVRLPPLYEPSSSPVYPAPPPPRTPRLGIQSSPLYLKAHYIARPVPLRDTSLQNGISTPSQLPITILLLAKRPVQLGTAPWGEPD